MAKGDHKDLKKPTNGIQAADAAPWRTNNARHEWPREALWWCRHATPRPTNGTITPPRLGVWQIQALPSEQHTHHSTTTTTTKRQIATSQLKRERKEA
jgi:hypothetical protein